MLMFVMITAATVCLVADLLTEHVWLLWAALSITVAGGALLGFILLNARRLSRSAAESGEPEPAESPDGEQVDDPRPRAENPAPPARPDDDETRVRADSDSRMVQVVPGRRRFHLRTCRILAGRSTEEIRFEEAREEGLSPCSVCLPDRESATTESVSSPNGSGVGVHT